jgi:hypothetical protein
VSTSRRIALALLILLDVTALVLWVRARARPDVAITVADAASHSDAASFELAGGNVRTDLGVREGGLAVAPVVPTRWTPDAPVPMWAVTGPGGGALPSTVSRARAVDAASLAPYRALIATAERTNGIHGEVGAPIVFLEEEAPASPSNTGWIWNVLLGLNLVLASFALVNRDRKPA